MAILAAVRCVRSTGGFRRLLPGVLAANQAQGPPARHLFRRVQTGRMFAGAYRDQGLHAKNLSRVAEDAGTVTANLVPWNSGGVYQAATLGVPTLLYAPFAFFNWLSPLVTLLFGWFGWTIAPLDDEDSDDKKDSDTDAARGGTDGARTDG